MDFHGNSKLNDNPHHLYEILNERPPQYKMTYSNKNPKLSPTPTI